MNGDERRLDGNAAGGLLGEVFPFEMTMVQAVCANCGAMERVGNDPAYMDAPGVVVRCVHCDHVLIKIAQGGDRIWLDLRGVVCLQFTSSERP
jgi:hypothetical protein